MAYPRNFLGYIDDKLPALLSGTYGSKFFGLPFSMGGDLWSEAARRVVRLHLVRHEYSPDDVLPYVSRDRGLIKYPREAVAEWRERLADAWNIWASAGSNGCIAGQLTAAKFVGGTLLFEGASQFWIRLPAGSHYVDYGSAITDEDLATLRFIAFTFSDVRFHPRGVIVEFDSSDLSDGFGDAGFGDAGLGDDGMASTTFSF